MPKITTSSPTSTTTQIFQEAAPDTNVNGDLNVSGNILEDGVPVTTGPPVIVNGVFTLPSTVYGTTTLVGGSKIVLNADVSASSVFLVTIQGTPTPLPGGERSFFVTNKIPGVSFTIQSTRANDASTVAWLKIG